VPGYDLIESGPRANVGMMAEALFPSGEMEAQVGQTYRSKPDPLFATLYGEGGTASDIVAGYSLKFAHLDVTDHIAIDSSNGSIKRNEIYLTGSYDRSSLQISYIQLPQSAQAVGLPGQREINAQADINVWRNW
jgi:LPS-assembly protein